MIPRTHAYRADDGSWCMSIIAKDWRILIAFGPTLADSGWSLVRRHGAPLWGTFCPWSPHA